MPIVRLMTPKGGEIRGTLERVLGCAFARTFEVLPDGTLSPEYEGETDICWDSQETVTERGDRVYVDWDGNEWLESTLSRVTVE